MVHNSITKRIELCEPSLRIRIKRARKALAAGNILAMSFNGDGSGMDMEYWDENANHGTPGRIYASFSVEEAVLVLAGNTVSIGVK